MFFQQFVGTFHLRWCMTLWSFFLTLCRVLIPSQVGINVCPIRLIYLNTTYRFYFLFPAVFGLNQRISSFWSFAAWHFGLLWCELQALIYCQWPALHRLVYMAYWCTGDCPANHARDLGWTDLCPSMTTDAPTLFATLGLDFENRLKMSGVMNVCQLVGVVISFLIMDKLGRRMLLLAGSIAMLACHGKLSSFVSGSL